MFEKFRLNRKIKKAVNKIVKESAKKTKSAFTDTVDEEERQAEENHNLVEPVQQVRRILRKPLQHRPAGHK